MAVVETLSFAVAVVVADLLLLSPGGIERLGSDYWRCCYSYSG